MVTLSRRQFLAASTLAGSGLLAANGLAATEAAQGHGPDKRKALIAITLDLEMARNFPVWEDTHWDYEKGNLNAEAKRYTIEAAKRLKDRGGVLHCFAVGRTLEQEDVDWLKDLARAGHPIGNHTYDHVNIKATKPQD